MNFVKDKIRMALFGLIIASVAMVHHVKASPSADSKQNGKEYPASRDNGNKSKCTVIDPTIIDTELKRALFVPPNRRGLGKTNEEVLRFVVPRPRWLKEAKRALGTRVTVIIILGKGRNEEQTENRILLTYCLVTSCLLLKVLICVVLQLCLRKKCSQTRTERQGADNIPPTATNPIYQPGLQCPCNSNPLPITHQGPYQSLIVKTSEHGATDEYCALEGGNKDNQLVGVPVDVTDYQDLDQTNPRDKYKSLLIVGSFSEDCKHYDEPNIQETWKETDAKRSTAADASSRSHVLGCWTSSTPSKHSPTRESQLNQSTKGSLHHTSHLKIISEKEPGALARNICNVPRRTDDQMHRVIEELGTTVNMRGLNGHDEGEPLYYVLEGPLPSPEPNRDPMYCVVKELESLNKNAPNRALSDDFTTEPLYCVLESPEDTEDKSSKEELTNK